MQVQAFKDAMKEKITTALKDNLKFEEKEFVNPWSDQDKASVLQQSRCFSDSPVDAHKCMNVLTRVLYLLQQGQKFTADEITTLFFGVTKLFQSTNQRLRRMVYLVIKELEPSEQEVFICMSCLIKDMNSKNDSFRANSLRVLARILDPQMAAQIDRYLKTAIVDNNPFVASSALVCGLSLMKTAPDVVRRWVNEIQETIHSSHQMVQFHALALIYDLKKTDRLALHKVVISLSREQLKSPMAECLLIRHATKVLAAERDAQVEKTLMSYLDSCLRHKSEMVSYEAARAFCQLAVLDGDSSGGNTVFGYDITHATTILQIFLTSPKPTVRFGAIRTLNQLAQHRPQTAAKCNVDMEPLLSDQNRNTATLALTTLLKTGHEANVEKLVKQITSFMSDISEVFKIEVVRAVKGLCLQYPSKFKSLMAFLSTALREDGTAEFKGHLVEALILIVSRVPAAREAGLLHLCEFIEDCEYPALCTKVLGFLGEEVPSTATPSKYIRFIYNRLILENAVVRASAVDALAKIAVRCPALRKDVVVLLDFGQNDNDDEVRDRIGLYSSALQQSVSDAGAGDDMKLGLQSLMSTDLNFSVDALYDGLLDHINSDLRDQTFDVSGLPTAEAYRAAQTSQAPVQGVAGRPGATASASAAAGGAAAGSGPGAGVPARSAAADNAAVETELARALQGIVHEGELGSLQHSCRQEALTESEAEYTVHVVRHMFQQHVVLELRVANTVQGIVLESVEPRITGFEPAWAEVGASAITRLEYGQQASAHVVLRKLGGVGDEASAAAGACAGSFGAALHFIVKEEGDDLGYEDDYPIEGVKISVADYICARSLPQGQWKSVWEQLSAQGAEATEKLSLNFKTLETAVEHILQKLNMEACDKTSVVEAGVRGHTLLLSGTFAGGNTTLVRALVGLAPQQNCVALKISCRAKSAAVCEVVAKALM